MVRHRKKSKPEPPSADAMKRAVFLVVDRGQSVRQTSKETGIPKSTLARYVSKTNTMGRDNVSFSPVYDTARVFNDTEENELEEYLLTASKHHHGLTTKACRDLAFQYAAKNDKKMPLSWTENQQAGEDWLLGFMCRHQRLSVRKPEATSLGRATSFNKKNVTDFFNNLADVMERYKFEPGSIYNCDETGLTTVQAPPNVIAEKKAKQVGQVTSAERGVLVTMLGTINALGNTIPPFMVFPRVHFKDHMVHNAPTGTKGVAYQSGWMTAANFETWLDHFVQHSHCSQENKVLLLLDNHDSHISINVLDKAKANGIVMLTFPPHCSHKLQPLDRTVYGLLKKYYNTACNSWQLNHPGQPMSIYDVAGILGEAFPQSFCPRNIISGFRVTGIYPFNREVFSDDEFLSSYVTDRPNAAGSEEVAGDEAVPDPTINETPQTPERQHNPATEAMDGEANDEHFSPEQVRPFPKAGPRKQKQGGRKKGKTAILTDTPVKQQLEDEFMQRELKRRRCDTDRKMAKKTSEGETSGMRSSRAGEDTDSDSSEDQLDGSSSSSEHTSDVVESSSDEQEPLLKPETLKTGDFVLVKYVSKRVVHHYVGTITKPADKHDMLEIKFLVRQPSKKQQNIFSFPDVDDIDDIDIDDIVQKLPEPSVVGGTKRTNSQLVFADADLGRYYRLH